MSVDLPAANQLKVPISKQCVVETAKRFNMPSKVLFALLKVEGGKVGQIRWNANGSYDMGPMQINSLWLDTFKSYASRDQLLYNGCVNVQAGAWILNKYMEEENGDIWEAVGDYHSHIPSHHRSYQKLVSDAIMDLEQ